MSASQLRDQRRDDIEVEGTIAQDVGGPDVLERGMAVHLIPEEALRLGEEEVVLGPLVLEHEGRGPAEARGKSCELAIHGGNPLRPALKIGRRARDLSGLEAVAILAADQKLDPRALGSVRPGPID